MFIVMVHYKKPIEIVEKFLAAHRAFLDEGYKKNYFVVSGPRNPRTGGVIISPLKNADELKTILAQDPFCLHDIADYEYIEFEAAKFHPQFAWFINE